ncbi:FtsX-like permease family protein [Amycolatopsis suaedae]|uniref:ABC transporter permease n=1 Tax=Amycolatopsis suaedae TaxID=2510978 RepID=A0A4Q7J1M9_9PSEU|nr:ABC transporter permease [Amycolatopsis suaedae]RZQ60376.1 ABC transporter permease [Amycolatopsis suaedae]
MLRLSVSTFTERWQLFVGAILTVCFGVALVQSSLLILVSAATAEAPPGVPPMVAARIEDGYTAALALLGVTLGISVFLAVFIVASTFAFTVAQRRRDLALLRLVGGAKRQVRRLLLSEAVLLGVIGTVAGVPLGLLAMRAQSWLLIELGFLPPQFQARWMDWILGVSAGVGVGVALAGVLVASRRASSVRPLEALRETGAAVRVMTVSRWFFGLLFLAGAVAMAIVAQVAGPEGAIPLAINSALAASVGLAALSPLVVPLVGRLFGLVLRGTTLGGLAEANLRHGVRRSAATAAPLLVLVALVIGQLGTMSSIATASERQQARNTVGDLVVNSTAARAGALREVEGVEHVSTETAVAVTATLTEDRGDEDERTRDRAGEAVIVDPADYRRTHPAPAEEGSLEALRGNTVAVGPGSAGEEGLELGATVPFTVDGRRLDLRVVAVLASTMNGGVDYVLPAGLVASQGDATSIVSVAPGLRPEDVGARIQAAGLGQVVTVPDHLAASASAQQDTQEGIMAVVMGLGGLYALMAVINAVVIAAAERRAEFATARLTGLTRRQVVGAALLESWAVTAVGVLLGAVAAAGSVLAMASALGEITGEAVIDVPWPVVGAVVAGAFLVVGATSVWTSVSATRATPVSLVAAKE